MADSSICMRIISRAYRCCSARLTDEAPAATAFVRRAKAGGAKAGPLSCCLGWLLIRWERLITAVSTCFFCLTRNRCALRSSEPPLPYLTRQTFYQNERRLPLKNRHGTDFVCSAGASG